MPLRSGWYTLDHVFFTELSGIITLADLEAIAVDARMLVSNYQGKLVHSVTDVRQMEKLAITVREITHVFGSFEKNKLDGWVIVAGSTNPMLRFIITTISQLFGFRFRMFVTLEEAMTFLNENDAELPPLLPLRDIFTP